MPQLRMVIEPETKCRFRYESEGGSHGALLGKQKNNGKKTYPTLKLEGYRGKKPVYIQASLFTEDKKEHVFEFKDHVRHIKKDVDEGNTAVFENLKICSIKKHEIEQLLITRRLNNIKDGISASMRDSLEKKYSKEAKERAKAILNSVRLHFEAFEEDKPNVPLCSLFSEVIYNTKTAAKGDLKIHRLSRVSGSCGGGDEVILLCDKIQKENIKVRFYETDCDKVIWESYGKFSPADVHYQVAICFKTPPYKMNVEREVFVCLERNGEMGDAVKYTYIPEETSKKRKYTHSCSSETSASGYSSSRSVESPPVTPEYPNVGGNVLEAQMPVNTEAGEYDDDRISEDINIDALLEDIYQNGLHLLDPENLIDDSENIEGEMLMSIGNAYTERLESQNLDLLDSSSFRSPLKLDTGNIISKMADLKVNCTSSESLVVEEKYENNEHLRKQFNRFKKSCSALLSKRDKFGNTLLHIAIVKNKDMEPLLKMNEIANARILNAKNFHMQTALHLATIKNDANLIKTLLRKGANPNIKDADGNNCYHIAARNNMHSIFDILLHMPKLDVLNYEGLTPLHIAVGENSDRFFDRARVFDIDPNITEGKAGKSLLHFAAQYQPSFVAKLLDMEDVDVNIQDFGGNTPLHIACAYENINAVKLLLEAGASPLVRNFKVDLNLSKENYEGSDSVGQLPADMTNNIEILTMLKNVSEVKPDIPFNICDHEDLSEANETADEMEEKLCNILDEDNKWKKVAPYFVDEEYLTSLESLSDSPTKALLSYIKKEYQKDHIQTFKTALEFAGFSDAIQIIEQSCF